MSRYESELDMFLQQYAERSKKLNKVLQKSSLFFSNKKRD